MNDLERSLIRACNALMTGAVAVFALGLAAVVFTAIRH